MRFNSLRVANLRAVRLFEASELKDFIVVAGQNGSGKSCVFDAIRLLKSVYGGYSANEYMQWFGEFAIDLQDRDALRRMFRDAAQPVQIAATIEFAESERAFMLAQASDLLWPLAWERVTGQRMDHWSFNRMAIATQLDQYRAAVEAMLAQLSSELQAALALDVHTVAVEISPNGNLDTARCLPAEVSFQAYQPAHLGIIEHHSASRAYTRQPLQGINLDAKAFEQERRQQTLYNSQAKYQNVKTEPRDGIPAQPDRGRDRRYDSWRGPERDTQGAFPDVLPGQGVRRSPPSCWRQSRVSCAPAWGRAPRHRRSQLRREGDSLWVSSAAELYAPALGNSAR